MLCAKSALTSKHESGANGLVNRDVTIRSIGQLG